MSEPIVNSSSLPDCPGKASGAVMSPPVSPGSGLPFRLPMRRTRTISESEKILAGPSYHGKITSFCRQKGHGFVQSADGSEQLFMHISDIEGDWVPKEGDDVTYKRCLVPPKNEKHAAVHVQIVNQIAGTQHEKWDKEALLKPDISEVDN